ncbi:hypothetical protein IQ274_18550 [Nostoc sp. LEGE 12447]|uniref:hypothetical protein n=1 Tax=Nostoc sp. LEGE 12447 TaxID=1828640 RepID=UPI0018833236|nr:hypothetical protein [Nostoc sp. LEGE 12447]MBE9000183.1 hypothetical protein [Nostoc sp. LEGE 12447]
MHSQPQQIHRPIFTYNPTPTVNIIPTKLAKVNGNVALCSSYAKIYSPSEEAGGQRGRGAGEAGEAGGDKGDKENENNNSQFSILNSQFSIPNSQFPIPNSQFPIPNSQFPIPNAKITI